VTGTVRHDVLLAIRGHVCLRLLRLLRRVMTLAMGTTRRCLTLVTVVSQWADEDSQLPTPGPQLSPVELAAGGRHGRARTESCPRVPTLRRPTRRRGADT
jgi:hypothetical protein